MFDGWCVERGITPLELPADRWLNLIEYFATRNMDEKKRKEWDNHIANINIAWMKSKLERALPKEKVVEPRPVNGRERRLPPKPAWYGSRDNATRDSLMAKSMLTSRNGRKPR